METFFASPDRVSQADLKRQIEVACRNPVIDGVMHTVGGLVAVLNQQRQILVVNQQLLGRLGVEDPELALGLRPGEAFGCCYAEKMEAGCGTSEYCMSCGAAIAIVASLGGDSAVDRTCAITTDRNGSRSDLYFHVHASPIRLEGEKFILLFLHDITQQQQRAALERTFFHDLNNTIMGLVNASELLRHSNPQETALLARQVVSLAYRLSREVELQRNLSARGVFDIRLGFETLPVDDMIDEIQQTLTHHPAMRGKSLDIRNNAPGLSINTDPALLFRVMSNMLINALEATHGYDPIRLSIDVEDRRAVFSVWNRAAMASAISCRVFQRNFSTKGDLGRGLGTYSMKLIGEQLLGGKVYFHSSKLEGTTFFLELPLYTAISPSSA